MQLIVHIGTGKTGTSSIQKTLGSTAAVLKQSGVAYIGLTGEELPDRREQRVPLPLTKDERGHPRTDGRVLDVDTDRLGTGDHHRDRQAVGVGDRTGEPAREARPTIGRTGHHPVVRPGLGQRRSGRATPRRELLSRSVRRRHRVESDGHPRYEADENVRLRSAHVCLQLRSATT